MSLNFNVKVHEVEIDQNKLSAAVATSRLIFDMPAPPEGKKKCKNCKRLDEIGAVWHNFLKNDEHANLVGLLSRDVEIIK